MCVCEHSQALLRKGFSSSRNATMRVEAHPIPAAAVAGVHYRLVVSPTQEFSLGCTDHLIDHQGILLMLSIFGL